MAKFRSINESKLSDGVKSALNAFNIGYSKVNEGDYLGAIEWYTKAIEIAGGESYYGAFNNRGIAKTSIMDYEGAIKDFMVFIKVFQNTNIQKEDDFNIGDTFANIGYSYFQLGKFNESFKYYEKTLAINPNDKDALNMIEEIIKNKNKEMDKLIKLYSDESYYPYFNYAIKNLQKWRIRYSKNEYPKKVLNNTLYKLYTVNFMWDSLINFYSLNKAPLVSDYASARELVSDFFLKYKIEKTLPILDKLIEKKTKVAGFDVKGYITKSENAIIYQNNEFVEELEFTFIYYYIANECLFRWFALRIIKKTKIEALGDVTGKRTAILNNGEVINGDSINSYEKALDILGAFGVNTLININYKKFPSFY